MTILAFASVPLSETQKRLDPLCQLQCSDKCQGAWLKHLLLAGRLAICQEIQFGVPLAWGWHKTQGSTMADWMQTKTSNAELPSTYEAGQIFVHPCPPNETVHHNHVEIRLLPVSHHNHISSVCVCCSFSLSWWPAIVGILVFPPFCKAATDLTLQKGIAIADGLAKWNVVHQVTLKVTPKFGEKNRSQPSSRILWDLVWLTISKRDYAQKAAYETNVCDNYLAKGHSDHIAQDYPENALQRQEHLDS